MTNVWCSVYVTRCTVKTQLTHWHSPLKSCVLFLCFGFEYDSWYDWFSVFGCICCILLKLLLCFGWDVVGRAWCVRTVVCVSFVFRCFSVEYCWWMSILCMMMALLCTETHRMPMLCMLCVKTQKIHIKDNVPASTSHVVTSSSTRTCTKTS